MQSSNPDRELFKRYIRNECTPDEAEAVLQWLADNDYNVTHAEVLSMLLDENLAGKHFSEQELQEILNKNASVILQKIQPQAAVISIKKFRWLRWTAAAVLLCTLSFSVYWLTRDTQTNTGIAQSKKNIIPDKKIEPGGDKALLTLANGETVVLDEADNGALAEQGSVKVIKLDGQLAYQQAGKATEITYNTITTPRGGQYKLVLADGTKVWLNAASSLRFPTSFSGDRRIVELSGEGYFEVAHRSAEGRTVPMSFIVKVITPSGNGGEVEVLGTHFNIMAYADENAVKTTLLEGSVKIRSEKQNTLLKPGQQASLQNEKLNVSSDVDVEEVVAWKEGYFQFNRKAPIEQVMRQVERWYDVDVGYAGAIPKRHFGGKIARDSRLEDVLKILELNSIHFKIEGRKITVTP